MHCGIMFPIIPESNFTPISFYSREGVEAERNVNYEKKTQNIEFDEIDLSDDLPKDLTNIRIKSPLIKPVSNGKKKSKKKKAIP